VDILHTHRPEDLARERKKEETTRNLLNEAEKKAAYLKKEMRSP
jgi:hypothetical protein